MTDQTAATPEWHDGDPLMAAIAAAVWEHCHTAGTCVSDDPRNIAAAAAAGIRDAARQATGQPDTEAAASPVCECQPVRLHDDYREAAVYLHEATCPTVGQPAAPADLTPHEARQRAEQQLDGALRIVIDYVIESNDVGGLDCNDLADRLRSAGYELPDDEDES